MDDTATAYGLALAYNMTGDVKYAQKSRDFICGLGTPVVSVLIL